MPTPSDPASTPSSAIKSEAIETHALTLAISVPETSFNVDNGPETLGLDQSNDLDQELLHPCIRPFLARVETREKGFEKIIDEAHRTTRELKVELQSLSEHFEDKSRDLRSQRDKALRKLKESSRDQEQITALKGQISKLHKANAGLQKELDITTGFFDVESQRSAAQAADPLTGIEDYKSLEAINRALRLENRELVAEKNKSDAKYNAALDEKDVAIRNEKNSSARLEAELDKSEEQLESPTRALGNTTEKAEKTYNTLVADLAASNAELEETKAKLHHEECTLVRRRSRFKRMKQKVANAKERVKT